jgi:hypothetical protein
MKDFGVVAVLSFFVLAGLALFLFLGPLAEKPGMRGVEENPQGAPQEPQKKARAAASQAKESGESGGSAVEDAGEAGLAPKAPGAAGRRRFPTAADVSSGMDRSRLQALFGPPNMHTVSVEQGVQLETYVYLNSEPESATFILLKSGRVVSVTTTSY